MPELHHTLIASCTVGRVGRLVQQIQTTIPPVIRCEGILLLIRWAAAAAAGAALAAGERGEVGAEPRHSHPFLKPESHRRCSPFTFLQRTASFREPPRRADYPRLFALRRGKKRFCFSFQSVAVREP